MLSDSGMLSEGYLSAYSYGTEATDGVYISSYSSNGGHYGNENGNTAAKAFDGSFSTFWETGRPNSAEFVNNFTVTFSAAAQVDRLIYATRQDSYAGRGYPSVLTAYISASDSGEDFEKICSIASSNGGSKVVFDFGGIYECRRMRLEFTEISSDLQYASASELIFLKPEEEAVRAVRSAFSDYNCLTLSDGFEARAEEYISAAAATAAYAYSDEVKMLTDRAGRVVSGDISYNSAWELSSADGAANPIARVGDVAGYARNTLKMGWMGTNRQVTGIGAEAGAELTVFVDCADGDPLPSIECSQFIGTWSGWKSGSIKLSKGVNFITVPKYFNDGWTNTVPGGPLYIVNPYTKNEQSGSVKVYIEGGYAFPVYRAGDDEKKYLDEIENYLADVAVESDRLPDMTELTCDNVILTVTASQARRQYAEGGYSPAEAMDSWTEYMTELYGFCGVYDEKYADERSQYLNVNIRVMQSLAGAAAYAHTEHIGIYPNGDWEVTCLRGSGFGWGVTHEIGHMMDISERTWGEYTNNMWSQFNQCALAGENARGNFSAFLDATVKDDVPQSERDAYANHTDAAISWWLIESRYPGFWGRFENNYRYADRAGITNKAELHVYFASLAAGADLSYYFERIGFNWSGNTPFGGYDSASAEFRAAIDSALSSGKIIDNHLKLWYLGADAYNYTVKYGSGLSMYTGREYVRAMCSATTSGMTLLMDDETDFRHLGYEILRGNDTDGYKVIGFTYGRMFTDTNPAEGEEYRVRAYDRALGCSAMSEADYAASGAVARTDGQDYSTLAEAIAAASSGGTVYVLSDSFAAGIDIDKNITIVPSSDATLYLSASSAMFTVRSGASLTIAGEGETLVLDGLKTTKNDALIVSNGTLSISGDVTIKDSVNAGGNGGALRIAAGTLNISGGARITDCGATSGGAIVSQAGSGATFNISGAVISGNAASSDGGAIHANCIVNIEDTAFENNSASNGGAININGGGILSLSGCTFTGNSASGQGGALRLDGSTSFGERTTVFAGNTANRGGAVYVASENNARRVTLSSAEFIGNTAWEGGAVYIYGHAALGSDGTALKIAGKGNGSSAIHIAENANLSDIAGTLSLDGGVTMYSPLSFGSAYSASGSSINAVFTLPGDQTVVARFASDASATAVRAFAVTDGGAYAAYISADGAALEVSGTRAYTVAFTDRDDARSEYYAEGESMVLPGAEPPDGYEFRGWSSDGKLYAAGDDVTVTSDMTFTAEYELLPEPEPDDPGDVPDTPDVPGEDDPVTPGGNNPGTEDPGNDEPDDGGAFGVWAVIAVAVGAVLLGAVVITVIVHLRFRGKNGRG